MSDYNWLPTKLKGEQHPGWRTEEGEWLDKKHPLLKQHELASIQEDIKWFVPYGVMRYKSPENTMAYREVRSCFEVYDSRDKLWYGPYPTFAQAENAFEARGRTDDG